MTSNPRALLLGVLASLALGLAACGGSDSDDAGGGGGTPAAGGSGGGASTANGIPGEGTEIPQGRQGGTLRSLSTSDVDYMDPGHSYFQGGFQVIYATGRPLYNYRPGSSERVPDLAEAEPEISSDGRELTIRIKSGVRYAPPVNREVVAADVKYAIERAFSENVGGQYTNAYFSSIEGAPEEPTDGVQEISGITAPDDNTLVIRLTSDSAPEVSGALELPISIPVPEDYAREFDAENPSTYNEHVVASGPYMVENNAEGELTGWEPTRSISLVRNPNWDKATDFKPAFLDSIEMTANAADAAVATRQVLQGQSMVQSENPPASALQTAVTDFPEQITSIASGGFRWFPINTKLEPFDDLNVRKAVIAAFDRNAARQARGGRFIGPVGTHFIPPGIPGFEEAGGEEGFGQDYFANPSGDMEVAARYMRAAGYASGRYDGDEEFLMITTSTDPGRAQAIVAQQQLEKLGFNVRLRQVGGQDAVYTDWCQVPARRVVMCGSSGWFKDYNDPQSMLEPTFKGSNIAERGNNNLPQLDVPAIDEAMDAAAVLPAGDERNRAWAQVDRMITDQAPAIPFVWDDTSVVASRNVNLLQNVSSTLPDLTFSSLK